MVSRRVVLSTGAIGCSATVIGAGSFAAASTRTDTDTSADLADSPGMVDVGFCQDMTTHHVQALAMCQRVLGRDTGDAIQAAAAEVLMNQAIEVGMMRAWLADWGESTRQPELVMAWMMPDAMGMPLAMMPGYASADELRELSMASGDEQARLWLMLMRAHHVGGVAMAEHAAANASSEKVVRLASTQVATQTFEIGQYDLLLSSPDAE